ncbi:MAG: 50S ribosomal protein L3 [Candidatus Omnitrophica bacterium]|nr:50S ribosomal protein L3 [Candidatus Omnitrophota bacterium]MBU1048159.1 50S ribosomal protein L3 [Candidatus Omnitrophota bacterium]MBU1630309.1 50S ribosomal protein L3 [Candidatus Omnitrophota bacterium]MBU1767392.1 50S ribosomal protein L3 [Candidatus Omnitrophota bacterium]MBU1889254.1 50S ribosomal protein L3 [Candidatus Omnitrophota bacterium]
MIGLIGKKVGMTQIFSEEGKVIPVTVIKAGPCKVVQKKTKAKDGYDAIQLGFGEVKESRASKPCIGHFKKIGLKPMEILEEIRIEDLSKFKECDEIKVDIFSNSKFVNVQGITKGKGFMGVMKRWGFKGMPASHGTHRKHRHPGSIGQHTDPGRVFKGKKMGGKTGNEKITVKKLSVAGIDLEKNILLVKGSVPGSRGSALFIFSDLNVPVNLQTTQLQAENKPVSVEK